MDKVILGDRNKHVLTSVINEYILTAEPVGSRKISKKYNINLSSATIRNVMSDLEDMGLLHQPHTSAGRIPTEKALRFYVNSILRVKRLNPREKDTIRKQYNFSELETSDVVKQTSEVLSVLSHNVSIVSAPKIVGTILKHIEFIKISKNRILVIFVSQSGFVQNRIVEDKDDISQDELASMVNVSRQTIHSIERGKKTPSVELALSKLLDMVC